MLRRGVGIGALQQRQQIESTFKKQGEAIAESQLATINRQLALFKTALEEFARKHRSRINKNPEFRAQFQQLCASVGVDPLASAKGFWAKTLGLGDFYNELGVQILDVCLSTRSQNGGLIEMRELCRLLMRMRGPKSDAISQDDVERSLRKACSQRHMADPSHYHFAAVEVPRRKPHHPHGRRPSRRSVGSCGAEYGPPGAPPLCQGLAPVASRFG